MAPSGMRALKEALKTREFAPVYLFHGDDDFLKEEKVRELIERATDSSTRDFNLDLRRGGELDAASLGLALDSLPMMADRRVVVVRDAGTLKKDAKATLVSYLARPATNLVLVLVFPAGSKPEAPLLERALDVEFKPLGEDDLAKWVVHHAQFLGATITPAAAELLCRTTGSDLAALAGELDKLRSFANGAPINGATVESVVGVKHGETLSDILDLVASREGVRAVALLKRVLAQPKTTGVSILMALVTQTLAIGWVISARTRGLPQHQLERELFDLLKENPAALVGRPWGEGVKGWVRAMRHWDDAAVDRALELLHAADVTLKGTRVSTEEQVLGTLLLAMSSPRPRRAAA